MVKAFNPKSEIRNSAKRFDGVIFDIDNVLVDTRASYTDCIRKTVEEYLKIHFRFKPSRTPLLTRSDVEKFKSLGGFNDDWDTCYGLLLYLATLKPKRRTLNDLRKQIDLAALLQKKLPHPLGVKGAEKLFGEHVVGAYCNTPLPQNIVEIFQALYQSKYVWNERLLISKAALTRIKKNGLKLGIFTGRNREEALFALRRFRIDQLFDSIVALDDTPKRLKKPNPYGLFQNARRLGWKLNYLYAGDLPDDILTAKRAQTKMNVTACGFVGASIQREEMKKRLKKAGAGYVVKNSRELLKLVLHR